MEKKKLSSLLAQANMMRFKLLAIIGKDDIKKNKIIDFLTHYGWSVVDVGKELIDLKKDLDSKDEISIESSTKIKE